MLEEKTVSLWKLKGSVGKLLGNTSTDPRSHYQRLKRWLKLSDSNKHIWAGMLQAAAGLLEKKSRFLILDGSSWKWGGKKHHFLTLSVLYQGVSIPLWWQDLKKLGISSQWERKLLLWMARKVLNLKGKVLLADREYVGTQWFETLRQAGIELVIRLRKGNYKYQLAARGKSVGKLENKAKSQLEKLVWKKFTLEEHDYYYVLKAYRGRGGKIEFLRLISTVTPALAMEGYGYRYRIETMFKHLKSNGFQVENLNIKTPCRVEMMMAVLVLAYTLSVVYGLKNYKRRIGIKKHGCPEMSVFRYGLDLWQNHLQTFKHFLQQLFNYCKNWCNRQNNLVWENVP